jgi:2-amino-4-hydroxy-6-hydroxymethyldihydropteridine diphosphokinase
MKLVYVAVGSNLGPSEITTQSALTELQEQPEVIDFRISHWYRSKAIGGPIDQPDYLNAVCCFLTSYSPDDLLIRLQALENSYGRIREVRWGPRTLDLDIIWIDGFTSTKPHLTIPHPRAHQRAFVLLPLLDLKADFLLQNRTLTDLAETVSDQALQQLPY